MAVREKIALRYCLVCGGSHMQSECLQRKPDSGWPLETPSHNGEYKGSAPVRILPAGFSFEPIPVGEELKPEKKSRKAVNRRCDQCKKYYHPDKRATNSRFCSRECRRENSSRRPQRSSRPPRPDSKTKWSD